MQSFCTFTAVVQALTAFLRVICRVAASQELRDFGKNPAMKAVFGEDFRVSMGFGLHVGWAIEGNECSLMPLCLVLMTRLKVNYLVQCVYISFHFSFIYSIGLSMFSL
jgi:hypothetical protein